jgi:predicted phosphodiesterase
MTPNIIKLPLRNFLFASDLHLNHSHPQVFTDTLEHWDYDALVIAGDIGSADSAAAYLRQIHAAIGVSLLFVLGNHDYYHAHSVGAVRQQIDAEFGTLPVLRLNGTQIIELSPSAALVGVDGWADGRAGRGEHSAMRLNDSFYIGDLYQAANLGDRHLFAKMRQLADADTESLQQALLPALEHYETVYVLTHVPPLTVTCRYLGNPSEPDALPFFCNFGLGEELQRLAKLYPQRQIKVLCGHTHVTVSGLDWGGWLG